MQEKSIGVIARIIITALSLLLVAELLPGIELSGIVPALIAATLLGLVNAVVRPVLIFLTLPITILTLGLFIFVVNGFLFWFVAYFIEGFHIAGFWTALFGSIIVSTVSSIISAVIK